METADIITALEARLALVDTVLPLPYDGEERKGWERETVKLLQEAYGVGSPELERFLDAPLGRLGPHLPRSEWQENYDYLLQNQAKILKDLLVRQRAAPPGGAPRIGVVGRPAPGTDAAGPPSAAGAVGEARGGLGAPEPVVEHPLLDAVCAANKHVPEAVRKAIIGLENLLKAHAPWPDVRQQIFVVLAAERPIADPFLRALPDVLHLCTRDR